MKRGSAFIVFLFACIGMLMTQGSAVEEPNSLSSFKSLDWWYWWWGTFPPSPPSNQEQPPSPPAPPTDHHHHKQPPTDQKQPPPSPPSDNNPQQPPFGVFDPMKCAQAFANMGAFCMPQIMQTLMSGRSYISSQCCKVIKEINMCTFNSLTMQYGSDFFNKYIRC